MSIKSCLFGCAALCAVIAGNAGAEAASTASMGTDGYLPFQPSLNSVSISNNSGGMIALFALHVAEFREAGTFIEFSGRCDSACTLFLSLPEDQTCVSPGAYFRFHAPSARSSRAARMAQTFMMDQYPDWVRSWIAEKGGLSHQLFTMDYAYASQFIPPCENIALY